MLFEAMMQNEKFVIEFANKYTCMTGGKLRRVFPRGGRGWL